MVQITNGQKVRASFDLFDKKDKPFEQWPAGSTISITGGDAGGASGVAQWVPDSTPDDGHGTITTEGDNVGTVSLVATGTQPDGTTLTDTLVVEVIHSAAGAARFTVGTPEDE